MIFDFFKKKPIPTPEKILAPDPEPVIEIKPEPESAIEIKPDIRDEILMESLKVSLIKTFVEAESKKFVPSEIQINKAIEALVASLPKRVASALESEDKKASIFDSDIPDECVDKNYKNKKILYDLIKDKVVSRFKEAGIDAEAKYGLIQIEMEFLRKYCNVDKLVTLL